ncbi:MAG: FmdB family transcriptional regulator [Acidimicrobiia bacterium]|nr:FmdB family transcriptional regulator [Acidimicrobiia bacterium]
MPTYEYVCSKCDQHIEVYQTFAEEPLKRHAGCGGKLTKVLGAVGIVLKGSGFYRTDNPSSSRRSAEKSDTSSSSTSSDSKSSESKSSESKSSDSKSSDSKSSTKSDSGSKPSDSKKSTTKKSA